MLTHHITIQFGIIAYAKKKCYYANRTCLKQRTVTSRDTARQNNVTFNFCKPISQNVVIKICMIMMHPLDCIIEAYS